MTSLSFWLLLLLLWLERCGGEVEVNCCLKARGDQELEDFRKCWWFSKSWTLMGVDRVWFMVLGEVARGVFLVGVVTMESGRCLSIVVVDELLNGAISLVVGTPIDGDMAAASSFIM